MEAETTMTVVLFLLVLVGVAQSFQLPMDSGRMPKVRATQLDAAPKLIVLDLDNTLWTPELYQLREIQRRKGTPVAHRDIKLLEGAKALLSERDTKFAIASRTKSVEWAQDLLDQFGIRDKFDHIEIFPGHKKTHFANIQKASGIAYSDMMFFDDARDGKYGNCVPVAELGVFCVHCPNGLASTDIIDTALERYDEWDKTPNNIVEWDGSVSKPPTADERIEGTVKFVNQDKRYGFLQCKGPDVFFHFNNLPDGCVVNKGTKLSFMVQKDQRNGKTMAGYIELVGAGSAAPDNSNSVPMRAFSMNMPFAALLANGCKTLETRNGTMFVPYPPGTQMLLHIGRRTYPDGDRHLHVMASGGLDDAEIAELKSLPRGFGRGMAVAILEIGETYEANLKTRSDPDFQRKVAAYGADSGKMVTEIRRVAYLKRPLKVSAQGGVFPVLVDPSILPDGWTVNAATTSLAKKASKGQPVYTISG